MEPERAERLAELDWLRVLAVLLLVYYHTAAIFVHWDSVVNNPEPSLWADIFILFVDQWYMPLFFLIAGASTRFSLERRSGLAYAGERTKRLFVPLVFGMLVVVPPQVYFERLQDGLFRGSFLDFYGHLFDGFYPAGNLSWHHLWFVAYLLVLSLCSLPVLLWLKGSGRPVLEKLCGLLRRRGLWLFLPSLPLAATETLLRPRFSGPANFVDDWASVCFFGLFFLYGNILYSDERALKTAETHRRWILTTAVGSSAAGIVLFLSGRIPGYGNPLPQGVSPGWVLLMLLRGVNAWAWVLFWVALARRRLAFRSRLLAYASEAAYPFYILHETWIVAIGYQVARLDWGVAAKYLAISTAGLAATLFSYEILVRRIAPIRFFLGMRPVRPLPAQPG
jgi:glucan biosynthesis protein C